MKNTKHLKSGLRAAVIVTFFAAAGLSTGCSNNALMNPQIPESAQSVQTANGGGQVQLPGGQVQLP